MLQQQNESETILKTLDQVSDLFKCGTAARRTLSLSVDCLHRQFFTLPASASALSDMPHPAVPRARSKHVRLK